MSVSKTLLLPCLLAALLVLTGCSSYDSSQSSADGSIDSATGVSGEALDLRFLAGETWRGEGPIGWIYAGGNLDDAPSRSVVIWADRRWTLAEETSPGFYDSNKVSGTFTQSRSGDWVASGFPGGVLHGYTNLYSAGPFTATTEGRVIPIR